MRIVLLLAVATASTRCDTTYGGTKLTGVFSLLRDGQKTSFRNLTKLEIGSSYKATINQNNSSDRTLIQQRRPSKGPHEKMKNFTTKSREDRQNISKSICSISTEPCIRTTTLRNDTLTEMEWEQIFKDVEIGDRAKRHVMKDNANRSTTWKNGVFYTFNTSDQVVQKVFKMGVKVWSENTCIDFLEDKNAWDKLVVAREGESHSGVGRLGGDQILSLDEVLLTEGTAVHEIGHALGLLHTMQRFDRDNFISVLMQNLDHRYLNEFARVNSTYADVYGLSYDFGSIMHYDEFSGSDNDQPTMISLDPKYQKTMGSDFISFSDVFIVNEHYGCNANCNKSTSAKCAEEGFPHPRNCSICICPGGYGGDLCDRRPPGCGEDLQATRDKQLIISRVGRGMGLRDHFDFCNYMITAPEGKRIEVDLLSVSDGYDDSGCRVGGVEIKAQKDQKMTGYRFCSRRGSAGPIVSNSNRLPIILYNKRNSMGATLVYRYVN